MGTGRERFRFRVEMRYGCDVTPGEEETVLDEWRILRFRILSSSARSGIFIISALCTLLFSQTFRRWDCQHRDMVYAIYNAARGPVLPRYLESASVGAPSFVRKSLMSV